MGSAAPPFSRSRSRGWTASTRPALRSGRRRSGRACRSPTSRRGPLPLVPLPAAASSSVDPHRFPPPLCRTPCSWPRTCRPSRRWCRRPCAPVRRLPRLLQRGPVERRGGVPGLRGVSGGAVRWGCGQLVHASASTPPGGQAITSRVGTPPMRLVTWASDKDTTDKCYASADVISVRGGGARGGGLLPFSLYQ